MTSLSEFSLSPPTGFNTGPTGYTPGTLLSEVNDSIACVSNSKKVLTMIAFASLNFLEINKT
ncbi:hypothetical protein HanRHA438_Chr00c13g0849931 [Helianthus annuus]|nr:hypothetical protein HanRHA438_Chr00c13g0849931 [Helianthus annuus]